MAIFRSLTFFTALTLASTALATSQSPSYSLGDLFNFFGSITGGVSNTNQVENNNKIRSFGRGRQCKANEFFYEQRSCCLPHGGPGNHPSPPGDKQCPYTWYWHHGQGCCVPHHPSPPPPTCPPGSHWERSSSCCKPTGPKPPGPQPSGYAHQGESQGHKQRKMRRRHHQVAVNQCPPRLTSCPVFVDGSSKASDFECLDLSSELESCGGCASLGRGQDCSKVAHAVGASCYGGACIVETCIDGFRPNAAASACERA